MAKRPVIVGLDRIVWNGSSYTATHRQMVRGGLIEDQGYHPSPQFIQKRRVLREIGAGVMGIDTAQINRLALDVGGILVSKVNREVLAQLRDLSPKKHQFIAMSSAPDFIVAAALARLRDREDFSFTQRHMLTSTFGVADGVYTGEFDQLEKEEAVNGLVQELGKPIKVGFINGVSDLRWSSQYCQATEVINPGAGLARRLVEVN